MSLRERPQVQKVLSSPMTEAFAQLRAQRKAENASPVRAPAAKLRLRRPKRRLEAG
jgi:hypothetical protein